MAKVIFQVAVIAVAAVVIVLRGAEVLGSEDGLWPDCASIGAGRR